MNNDIEKAARALYPEDKDFTAFMTGFEKAANELLKKEATDSALTRGLVGLGVGLAGPGIVKGLSVFSTNMDHAKLRNKFNMALAQVMANNKVVKGAQPEKAKEYAETIFKFAPNVASDPNLLSSILANAVLGEGVDPMTIKNLVDLEGRYKDNISYGALPAFRTA